MGNIFQIDLMAENMGIISSAFKLNSQNEHALGAFICTAHGKKAIAEKIRECREIMKSEHGAFSEFRGHMELPLIVKMSLSDDPKEYLKGVADTYGKLSAKHKLGNDSRLLAAVIIFDNGKAEELDRLCAETMEIYEKVKDTHPILAGQDVLPMLALLVLKGMDPDKAILDMEECYQELSHKFKLSKSAVLTIGSILALNGNTSKEKSDMFLKMYEAFRNSKMSLEGVYMAILAVLVNGGIMPEEAVLQTKENNEALKKVKGFHGVFGIDARTIRTYAAAITSLNNTEGDITAESAVMSTVLSIIISIEMMVMLMILYSTT